MDARAMSEAMKAKARALGFDAVGIARADRPLTADFERYEAFVEAGMHGEMDWLANDRNVRARLDTGDILTGARSVICVARRYQRGKDAEATDAPLARSIARYARGRDYHNGVRKKLRRLAAFARTLGGEARPMVDDVPVLERAWAARAGLGFVGKNGMLIVPGEGSFVLLGEVVTTLALEPDASIPERCGACTRCLEACPTQAFPRPFVLDARRCISYLTIERRSAIEEPLRAAIGEHLFGCDECQTVCPFNASSRPCDRQETAPFEPHSRWSTLDLVDLLDPARWVEISEGTPVHRATADGLARNAAIVLANQGRVDALPALAAAAERHPSATVRDTCAWAARVLSLATR